MINAITPVRAPLFGQVAPAAAFKTDVPEALQAELKAKGIEVTPDTEYTAYSYKGPFNPEKLAGNAQWADLQQKIKDDLKKPAKNGQRKAVSVIEFDSSVDAQRFFKLNSNVLNVLKGGEVGGPLNIQGQELSFNMDASKIFDGNTFETPNGNNPDPFKKIMSAIQDTSISSKTWVGTKNPKQVITYQAVDFKSFIKQTPNMLNLIEDAFKNKT